MQMKKFLIQVTWLKNQDLSAKITEIEGKIPSITVLAINSPLIAVENEIPDVSSLVKKDSRI